MFTFKIYSKKVNLLRFFWWLLLLMMIFCEGKDLESSFEKNFSHFFVCLYACFCFILQEIERAFFVKYHTLIFP